MIFRSPHPDVAVPDIALHRLVLARAAERGTKPALIDGPSGRILTYAALTRGADRVAAGLAARGFKKGDVLGLFTPNLPEFALVFHGTLAAGGVVTTINSLATEQDVEHQLRNAGARVLVTVPPFLDRAAPAASKLGIDQLFVLGEAVGTTPFAALLATDAPAPEVTINPARDLAVLPYSSGTTGFPKGVMLTHRNLVANLLQTGAVHTLAAEDRVMAVLPFFHLYGMQVVMNLALWYGATLVTMPKFELEPFLGLVQQHRITRAFVVPPIVLALAKHPAVDGYDLSSLRRMMSGAAPLDAGLETACARRLGCELVQGYGLTAASPVTHANSDEQGRSRPGAGGPPLPTAEGRGAAAAPGGGLGPGADGRRPRRGRCRRDPDSRRSMRRGPQSLRGTEGSRHVSRPHGLRGGARRAL